MVVPHRISVAPMLDWTDRHCRYFLRLMTQHSLLYTEMVTTGALLHGDPARFLAFDAAEHPIALQLGGSDPADLAACAQKGADYGYDEINLNIGCPSNRVQAGRFGACLMAEPQLVGQCISAMRERVTIPVTVKCRIGIDQQDEYERLYAFIATIANAGCETVIVHARKAWLQGLSPKENREIPPLEYETVYRLKHDFPALAVIINGGISDLEQAHTHLKSVDGVMIGRAAYHSPYVLANVDHHFYQAQTPIPCRHTVIERFLPYVEKQLAKGVPLQQMTRPILGIFQDIPGARAWRRHLSEHAHRPGAGVGVIHHALGLVGSN